MQRSRDRILTTHAGSLPRPEDLVSMMYAKIDGEAVDAAALDDRIRRAVVETVARQIDPGIAVISDGEMSKPSFMTYVADCLTGFGGRST
jgi:5-methyltetrahydropteroyltriglutamate--homocysteine methyltransferase